MRERGAGSPPCQRGGQLLRGKSGARAPHSKLKVELSKYPTKEVSILTGKFDRQDACPTKNIVFQKWEKNVFFFKWENVGKYGKKREIMGNSGKKWEEMGTGRTGFQPAGNEKNNILMLIRGQNTMLSA